MSTELSTSLVPNPVSQIHLLDSKLNRCNDTYICPSEIGSNNGLQRLVHSNLDYLLNAGHLCVFKEFPCGNGGSVDFLAINERGLVFLIEVKRAQDERSKYDVIFQVLRYHCAPSEILQQLHKCSVLLRMQEAFGLKPADVQSIAERAFRNIERRLMNPVVIIDEASYPLIAYAFSIALRDIAGEMRVIEINVQRIKGGGIVEPLDFLFVRRYYSTDKWIGNSCKDNRTVTDYLPFDVKLKEINNNVIEKMLCHLLKETGIRVRKVAARVKCFALVPRFVYFTFDPKGNIALGCVPRTNPPDNPYRIVAVTERIRDKEPFLNIGFRTVSSYDNRYEYLVFDLTPKTTTQDLNRIILLLRDIKSRF